SRDGGGLGRRQVQGWQRSVDVEAVAAAGTRLSPDRHASLLQGEQVTLDRAGGDLEALSQIGGAHLSGGVRAKLLDEGVQPIGAIHTRNGSTQSRQCCVGI